ncbi:MAG: FtsW/RodA/SpoVE family cell cycle protein [Clostridia bacterium]|nr:FtsW/RodA/SpoVE family cell cycle protein [Clostridia bacterium]
MFVISKIDYRSYKIFDKIAYGVTIILLLAVLIPGVGMSSGGATRWILIRKLQLSAFRNCKSRISYIFCFILDR